MFQQMKLFHPFLETEAGEGNKPSFLAIKKSIPKTVIMTALPSCWETIIKMVHTKDFY
jgi:hypothetical protein